MLFDDDLFSHLAPRHTCEYPLDGVHIPADSDEPVILILEYAGRGSAYGNAMLKLKMLDDVNASNERASAMFAKLAVKGWKNVAKGGELVPYSPEVGAEVLVKLIRAGRAEKVERALNHAAN